MAEFDNKKTRKAMLLSPSAGVLGVLPFMLFLNLGFGQWLGALLALLVLSYLLALIFGGIGYFVLKRLGLIEDKFLYAYGLVLVTIVAIAYADIYAFVSLAPSVVLVTALFCYLRGKPLTA